MESAGTDDARDVFRRTKKALSELVLDSAAVICLYDGTNSTQMRYHISRELAVEARCGQGCLYPSAKIS